MYSQQIKSSYLCLGFLALLLFLAGCQPASALPDSDVKSKTQPIRKLAEPFQADESKYGCGPLLQPGKTYYVSVKGDDKGDGLSQETAWRSVQYGVSQLKAGDTLLIGEGEYLEPEIQIGVLETDIIQARAPEKKVLAPQIGEPGKPIRIMAAPRQRVILTGAKLYHDLRKTGGTGFTYETPCTNKEIYTVWESDTQIILQNAGSIARVDELPGTYWLNTNAKKLYVHFSDSRGADVHGVRISRPRVGLRIHGSYVHVKGLWFVNYGSALYMRPNWDKKEGPDRKETYGDHITVEDCVFAANYTVGLHGSDQKWCLFKNNYGIMNGNRGSIMTQGTCKDNLIIGNILDSSAPTLRSLMGHVNYAINHYGGIGERNHYVGNIMADRPSFRFKPPCKQDVLDGNVFVGSFYSTTSRMRITNEADTIILRNNTILGRISWDQAPFGPGDPGKDFKSVEMAFVNNIAADGDAKMLPEGRFADPAYSDYRLQSDSPYVGKGSGGGDRGAYPNPVGHIIYVGTNGDDNASGSSDRLPLRTLAKAVSSLKAGDTLYIMAGKNDEPLAVNMSGNRNAPIRIRAYGKKRVTLPAVTVSGSNIVLEGLTVGGAAGDGFIVKGSEVVLRNCLVYGSAGAGVRAVLAKNMVVEYCTIAENSIGLALENVSTGAVIRDSIVAGNKENAVQFSGDSREGYLASHNCWFGKGVGNKSIVAEMGSIVADPLYANPKENDYTLAWNSPAACISALARPAGSETVNLRPIEIADVKISAGSDSTVVTWKTPVDDTFGKISYRVKEQSPWKMVSDTEQGTVHGIGIINLKPDTEYEYKVQADGRRGGTASTKPAVFRTTTAAAQEPATYYLSPAGIDDSDGKSSKTAWRTVRQACLMAGPGDTVLLAPGVYHNAIVPFKGGMPGRRITFKRAGEGLVLLDGGGVVAPMVDLQSKKHITVDGITFDNVGPGRVGVFKLTSCEDVEIINCRAGKDSAVSWLCGPFVIARGCRKLRIEGNVCWGTDYPIELIGCSDTLLKNNTIVNGTMMGFLLAHSPKNGDCAILNNIWYRPCIPEKSNWAFHWSLGNATNVTSDCNLFFSPYKNHMVGVLKGENNIPIAEGASLEEWTRKTGYDQHSVQADPMFVDVEKGDFRLKPGSPAIGHGRDGANIGALGPAP